jgi:DNA-binding MarR family transcriptional regulator
MDRLGLVRRERNPGDRRKLSIFLTPPGQALKAELMPVAYRINDIAARGIPADELAVCLSVLKRMSTNLSLEIQRAARNTSR